MKSCFPRLSRFLVSLLILIGVFLTTHSAVSAQTPTPDQPVIVYLFWGEGCPHCAKAKPFFENLANKYPELILEEYEIYYNEENRQLFLLMADHYGFHQLGVPTIFIGDQYLQGFSDESKPIIESAVLNCIQNGCIDPASGIMDQAQPDIQTQVLLPTPTPYPATIVHVTPTPLDPSSISDTSSGSLNTSQEITLPLFGKVNLQSKSALVSTILIALVDGFNPCSLWVLSVLLALTLHTGSRKKVFLIGIVFLTVTAAIYALFIVGLFSVLKITSFLSWIRILVSLIALSFAVINIKDYFQYKKGVSLTISDAKKPGIYKRIRRILEVSDSFWAMLGATVVLAAGVSLVEFSCTAGFPMVWTNILTTQNITGGLFVLLLILYMLIYQLDEMIIFTVSVVTLKSNRMEEKHGRVLKLISGTLMLVLSIVMLVKPEIMNSLSGSLLTFTTAVLAALILHILTKSITRPKRHIGHH